MRHVLLTVVFLLACSGGSKTVSPRDNGNNSNATGPVSWPSLSQWEKTKEGKNDVAVIIAIEQYAFLPAVPGAIETANDWEAFFRSRGTNDVFILTNNDAPAEQIQKFAKQAAQDANADGTLWFVFVGHGAAKTDGSDGLLVAMDAQQNVDSLNANSVAQSELVELLEKGKQAQTVMVLDTCFSGRSSDGKLLAKNTQPVVPITKTINTKSSIAILGAANADQVAGALPGAERPAFSYLLLGALRGWGDNDGDGNVTASEAVQYTQRQLRFLKGRAQTPSINGDGALSVAMAKETDPGITKLMQNEGRIEQKPSVVDGGKNKGTETNLDPVTPMITLSNKPFAGPDYGITFPPEWQVRTRIAKSDVMGDPNDGTGTTNVSVYLNNYPGADLNTIVNWELGSDWRKVPSYEALGVTDATIAGLPAKKVQYQFVPEQGGEQFVTQYFFKRDGDDGYFTLNVMIHPNDFARYGKQMQAIVESFRLAP